MALSNFLQQNGHEIKLSDNKEEIVKDLSPAHGAENQIDYLQIGSDVLNIFGYSQ